MSLELSLSPAISMGGGNPFGSSASFENSRLGMEFGEAKARSKKLMQRRLSRKCSTGKHHMLPPSVVLGLILYSRTWIFCPILGAKSSTIVA
jgi:hypothetical protein